MKTTQCAEQYHHCREVLGFMTKCLMKLRNVNKTKHEMSTLEEEYVALLSFCQCPFK